MQEYNIRGNRYESFQNYGRYGFQVRFRAQIEFYEDSEKPILKTGVGIWEIKTLEK